MSSKRKFTFAISSPDEFLVKPWQAGKTFECSSTGTYGCITNYKTCTARAQVGWVASADNEEHTPTTTRCGMTVISLYDMNVNIPQWSSSRPCIGRQQCVVNSGGAESLHKVVIWLIPVNGSCSSYTKQDELGRAT